MAVAVRSAKKYEPPQRNEGDFICSASVELCVSLRSRRKRVLMRGVLTVRRASGGACNAEIGETRRARRPFRMPDGPRAEVLLYVYVFVPAIEEFFSRPQIFKAIFCNVQVVTFFKMLADIFAGNLSCLRTFYPKGLAPHVERHCAPDRTKEA